MCLCVYVCVYTNNEIYIHIYHFETVPGIQLVLCRCYIVLYIKVMFHASHLQFPLEDRRYVWSILHFGICRRSTLDLVLQYARLNWTSLFCFCSFILGCLRKRLESLDISKKKKEKRKRERKEGKRKEDMKKERWRGENCRHGADQLREEK